MKFGTKASEETKSARTGGSGGKFINYFKEGDTRVRFLEEMGEWTSYWEHFHQVKRRSYPCTTDKSSCPGCIYEAENPNAFKASKRYLVNAVAMDTEQQYVNLYKIPISIKDDLERYADKDGSITARDYTVVNFKDDGGRVKYSVDREEREPFDISSKAGQMQDHEKALTDAYIEVWDELPEDSVPTIKRSEPKKPENLSQAMAHAKIDEEPPSEPAGAVQPEQASDEDEQELTEAEIRAMSSDQLKALFIQAELVVPDTNDAAQLADTLIDQLS